MALSDFCIETLLLQTLVAPRNRVDSKAQLTFMPYENDLKTDSTRYVLYIHSLENKKALTICGQYHTNAWLNLRELNRI